MKKTEPFDAIIIGGSYAGLSAAMALGRSLRQVLIIDSGDPCNKQTPHSHNFLTQDGKTPMEISTLAKQQLGHYPTVHFHQGFAEGASGSSGAFQVGTSTGEAFGAKKMILASGIRDLMPEIEGFAECWGTSVIHCPYCHGYEFRDRATGIMATGEKAYHLASLVHNLTKELTLFMDRDAVTAEQAQKLRGHAIRFEPRKIVALEHEGGKLKRVLFGDGDGIELEALYAGLPFEQHSLLPFDLGCGFTEAGHIQVDMLQRTTVEGIYACGDNSSPMRSLAQAIHAGNMAGAALNRELALEDF